EPGRVANALSPLSAGRARRAALRLAGPAAFDAGLNPKRRTKWARQARKLATLGNFDEPVGAEAVAAFFEVERRGWKGARRDALAFEDWALPLRPGAERPLRVWLVLAKAKAAARAWLKMALRRLR